MESAKLTRLISLGLKVKSSSASSENSSFSCSLSLFERRSLPAVLNATVLDVSLEPAASTKLNLYFEKRLKHAFTFVGFQDSPSLFGSATNLTQAHWMDSRYLVLLLITGIRKSKMFTQDGQISGFVEENLSISRKNGVKSELFATCLFEEKIISAFYFKSRPSLSSIFSREAFDSSFSGLKN